MKKVLSFMMAATMLFSSIPTAVYATDAPGTVVQEEIGTALPETAKPTAPAVSEPNTPETDAAEKPDAVAPDTDASKNPDAAVPETGETENPDAVAPETDESKNPETVVPETVEPGTTEPEETGATVAKEDYIINTSEYMTRLRTDYDGKAEFELSFKVRVDGEEENRFTAAMGEQLLVSGQIQIGSGKTWTFKDAGLSFSTAKTKSSYHTYNKEFIKDFYEQDTFTVTVITPEGYSIRAEGIQNQMDEAEREQFKNSLQPAEADKKELNEKIALAKEKLKDGNTYPQAAVDALKKALSEAETISAEPSATQDQVTEATAALTAAIEALQVDSSKYTIDEKYTFLRDQYGSKVLRIDIKEFNGGSDPAKKAFFETATISINGTDFGSMKALGFTITNYYGFELADLTAIKSVILDDELTIVLSQSGEQTRFTVTNELTPEQRQEIAGTEPEPEEDTNTIGEIQVMLLKSDDASQESMAGPTMKHEAQMLLDAEGNVTLVLHFEPAVIMNILAYATGLTLDGCTTEFVMKEDNSAVCIVKMPAFAENEQLVPGHISSSVMESDVTLKVTKPAQTTPMTQALPEKVAEIEAMLQQENFQEATKQPVLSAIAAAKNPENSITAYTNLVKAVAGLRKIVTDPFTGDTVFHVKAIDTSIIGSKSLQPYVKVEIVNGKKILTAHYNSYLDWDGQIYMDAIQVFNQDHEEIPSTYTLDEHKNGTLTFEMPYVPASGIFDVVLSNGNETADSEGKHIDAEIQMDYSTLVKGPFKALLQDAIDEYGYYTDADWQTRVEMEQRKDDFTPASWAVFAQALQKCKDDLQASGITQSQIDTDIENLKAARRGLVYKISAGDGSSADTGVNNMNNPSAPYYPSDAHAEYPEVVGWGGSKIIFGTDGAVYRVLNIDQSPDGRSLRNAGKILLMSESLRVQQPFTTDAGNVSVRWKDSAMRRYMNGTFYDTKFSAVEKSAIVKTEIETSDYQDAFIGPPVKQPGTSVSTKDFIFAPSIQMMNNEKYGYGSNDSRITPTRYALRDVMVDALGEYVILGVDPKGRLGGTYTLDSRNAQAPVCMYLDSSKILMTVDAKTDIPQNLTPVKKLDSNLWKLVLQDDNLKLNSDYAATVNGHTVSVDLGQYDGQVLAVIVEGNDFASGKIQSFGLVDASGFEVSALDTAKEKLYIMAIRNENGKTAYASAPALVNIEQSIVPGEPEKPETNEGNVTITMNQDGKQKPSMCDVLFAQKGQVEVNGDTATLKLYVVYPVPKFPDMGKDGTLKNFVVRYNGQEYTATSDITSKPLMTVKGNNPMFGLTAGAKIPAQVLTVELPKAALSEKYLDVNVFVNVFMNSAVDFDMVLSDLALPEETTAAPAISPNGGNFADTQEVTLTCETKNAVIYYTTDGTEPTEKSKKYTAPFTLKESATVKAVAKADVMKLSAVATAEFTKEEAQRPEVGEGNVTITMNQDGKPKPSMCDVLFAQKGHVEVNGDTATLKLYVAYPVPKFPEMGKDGTLKDFVVHYNGQEYTATSDITSKPLMTVKGNNPMFGLTAGAKIPAQVLTVELPKAALSEKYLDVNVFVNVFMNSAVDFDMVLTDLDLPEETTAAPAISPNGGNFADTQEVTLTCETKNAVIYYTTDGTEPTEKSKKYTAPFTLNESATVKAVAKAEGMKLSAVATAEFTKEEAQHPEVGEGNVTITMNQDGKPKPSMCDVLFAQKGHVEVNGDTATLKLYVAYPVPAFPEMGKDGTLKDFVVRYNGQEYTATSDITSKPLMTVKGNNPMFGLTAGAKIPAQILTVELPKAALSEKYLDVNVFVNVFMNSAVDFDMVLTDLDLPEETTAAPAISPNGGDFADTQEVTLTCATKNAVIYYTTDGTEPTEKSKKYTAPFTLNESATVKAVAKAEGMKLSAVATAEFTKEEAQHPEVGEGNVTITMNQDGKPKPSMCDVLFAQKGHVEVNGDTATLKLYVAYPVPKFPEMGKDGTLKDFVVRYNGQEYTATSDITSKPLMTVKGNNPMFGLTAGAKIPAQILTVELPKAALSEKYLDVNVFVNVFMNSAVDFDMVLTDLDLPEVPEVPTETVATPEIAPNGGNFKDKQTVTLTCATKGASIYYTVDGTDPNTNGTLYTAPFELVDTATVKVIAKAEGMYRSDMATAEFTKESGENKPAKLEDGKYYVKVNLWHETSDKPSMGDKAFEGASKALVTVKNGKVTTVQVGTTPVNMSGIISAITDIRISGSAVQVLQTEQLTTEPSGTEIKYIKLFSFQLPNSAQPTAFQGITYVPVQFKVPGTPMGDTLMDARLRLNWSTAEKTDDGQIHVPDVPVKPEGDALDVTDSATKIKVHADKGVFTGKVKLVVDPITANETGYDKIVKALKTTGETFKAYEVHFVNEKGQKVQPNGKVSVYYPIPDGYDTSRLAVYRINDDGTKTKISGSVENGYYKTVQKSFSVYALVETGSASNNNGGDNQQPDATTTTGDNTPLFAMIAAMLASGAVIAVLVLYKKRNKQA